MAMPLNHPSAVLLTRLAAMILIIAALYLAKAVFIPIALAGMLSFILTPAVARLERWHFPRIAAVTSVAILAFALIGGLGMIVMEQVVELTDSLPAYRANIKEHLRGVRADAAEAFGRAARMVKEVKEEVDKEKQQREPLKPAEDKPVPVRVQEGPKSTLQTITGMLSPVLGPLSTAAIVVVFVVFILIYRQELRDRVIRLVGLGRLHVTTRALDEAAARISAYLGTQLLINTLYGVPIGIGLWLMGLPGAALWGLLATLLRFIPYLGPWLGACLPIALSLAVFEGWTTPLLVAGLFVVSELVSNNILEPWLYGSRTGLSPVAVLLAAVFWSWLWGPVGLLLAIPMTACLVVLGRHVPHFEFLVILLGDEPALDPPTRFYQRLLAGDDEEAMDIAEGYRRQYGLVELYDRILFRVLHLQERDRLRGLIEPEAEEANLRCIREMAEEILESERRATPPVSVVEPLTLDGRAGPVLCISGRDRSDELATLLLAHTLELHGVKTERLGAQSLPSETLQKAQACGAPLVCISDVPSATVSHARYLCKRLRRKFPDLRIIVGLWRFAGDLPRAESRLQGAGADHIVTTLKALLDRLGVKARPAPVSTTPAEKAAEVTSRVRAALKLAPGK